MVKEDEILRARLSLLNEYVGDLRELQDVNFQTYEENKLIRRTVERTLHLAIEACLDIGQHIIAIESLRIPNNNQDVFTVLYEAGIVSDELLSPLLTMARFRNLIVHNYAHIDNAAVFGILKRRLHDFDRFAQAILDYLEIE